ncbi:MAG: hypothetical protein RJA56_1626 [Pseudomonadota bacterium]
MNTTATQAPAQVIEAQRTDKGTAVVGALSFNDLGGGLGGGGVHG